MTSYPLPTLPETREIVRRFNVACRAFDEAISASQARDVDRLEAYLLQSAREMGSALELSVARCAGSANPELRSQRHEFPALVKKLVTMRVLPLDGGRDEQLIRWRQMRNRAEHAPVEVPRMGNLLQALRGVRSFLADALGTSADLADPDRPPATIAPRPEAQRAHSTPIPPDETHRKEPPKDWVRARIDEGLARLNAGRAESPPLGEPTVRRSLLGLAKDLAELECMPSDPIPLDSTSMREIEPHRRLYMEAGWLIEDKEGLRFRDPRLPALLVGIELANLGINAAERRKALSCMASWAEAAWAATAAGDRPDDWLSRLLQDGDWLRLPERVVTACSALAGLDGLDRATTKLVESAAEITGAALIWLIPMTQKQDQPAAEPRDTWRLPRPIWQRAVLDLAKATGILRNINHSREPAPSVRALERLVAALGLDPRVSEATGRAVGLLCCPWPQNGVSPLDEAFFRALWSLQDGITLHVDPYFLEMWMVELGIPALWKGDPRRASRMLAVPDGNRPAGFLLNRSGLLSYWCEAWLCFAETETAEEAIRAWIEGATRAAMTGGLDDGVSDFFLQEAPERLRALNVWDVARAQLEKALSPGLVPTSLKEADIHYCSALFAKADLSPEAWRRRIAEWSEGPNLPWETLLKAGAPHDAIARWCLDKIQAKARETIKVDGPLGVLASGGQILKTEGWELAYEQAREALEWLLNHGDESAVAILADKCFSEDEEQRINPILGKMLEMSIPLSQVLWGRVIGRPGGRAALYRRVEHGEGLGKEGHFLPGQWLSTDAELWAALARLVGLQRPMDRAPTEDETAEAIRLLAAFEQWMSAQPHGFCRVALERTPWADPAMRRTKTLMVMCAVFCGLDVAERLHTLLRSIVDDANPHDAVLLPILGEGLALLCSQPEAPPEALFALAATPEVTARLNTDTTRAFWDALLWRLEVKDVLKLADAMDVPDMGLGFFDALAAAAPDSLDACQERPDLLRAVLVRWSEGRFQPSFAFYRRAWERPRKPGELRDLDRIPAGEWLSALLEQSRRWEGGERAALLRWLVLRSYDNEVGRQCLDALLADA